MCVCVLECVSVSVSGSVYIEYIEARNELTGVSVFPLMVSAAQNETQHTHTLTYPTHNPHTHTPTHTHTHTHTYTHTHSPHADFRPTLPKGAHFALHGNSSNDEDAGKDEGAGNAKCLTGWAGGGVGRFVGGPGGGWWCCGSLGASVAATKELKLLEPNAAVPAPKSRNRYTPTKSKDCPALSQVSMGCLYPKL